MNDFGSIFYDIPSVINIPGTPNVLIIYRNEQDNNYYVKKSDGTSELMFSGGSFVTGGVNVGSSNELLGVNSIIAGVYNRSGGKQYAATSVTPDIWQLLQNGDFTSMFTLFEFITVRDANGNFIANNQIIDIVQVGPVTRLEFEDRMIVPGGLTDITFTQDVYGNNNLIVGQNNNNHANFSAIIGSANENTQYSNNSLNVGEGNKANNYNVLISGKGGLSRWYGERVLSVTQVTNQGDTQISEVGLSLVTEDIAAVDLLLADETVMAIPDKCSMTVKLTGNAIQTANTSGGTTGDCQSYVQENLLIKRVGGVTSIVGAETALEQGTLAGTIAVTITGNSLNINVTPPNASPIKWTFHVLAVINTY